MRRSATKIIALAAGVAAVMSTARAETMAVADFAQHTHIHGLAVDRQDPSRLLIATHHGLFRATADGKAERVSEIQDFMGFLPHPADRAVLFASGHPRQGGNLGFIASRDGGKSWQQVSPGMNGPVDFHQIAMSDGDPNRVYGVYGGLQVSRDAGRSWSLIGPAPERLIALAASARDPDRLYAATESGLLVSRDAGRTWKPLLAGVPVTLVAAMPDGSLYAFAVRRGLLRAAEEGHDFTTVNSELKNGYLLHLTIDPANPSRMFAVNNQGRVVTSSDGGRGWSLFGN